jgi:hypothetical protein
MTKAQNLIDNEMWKDTPPVEVLEIHAKECVEWAFNNRWILRKNSSWKGIHPVTKELCFCTTSELYQIFNENK